MTWLDLIPEAIPPELRVQPFVLWRAEPDPASAKPRKVPYRIAEPNRKASSTAPSTWGSFPDAVDAYGLLGRDRREHPMLGPIAGIAVILTQAANIVCVDLDRVLNGETLDPQATTLVEVFDSFTEISPSGTGVHIFGRGQVPQAIKGEQIEVYGDARMICLTGHRWPGTPPTLHAVQPLLTRLSTGFSRTPRPASIALTTPPPDDLGGALLAKVRAWSLPVVEPLRPWKDGFLLELQQCPWAETHTTGPGGAAIFIRASGAFDFRCLHAHCGSRRWREFRTKMEMA